MNLTTLLFTALSVPNNDVALKNPVENKEPQRLHIYNIEQEILYESYIPIEALLFYIGVYDPSDRKTDEIISKILAMKKIIMKNRNAIASLYNFGDIVKEEKELSSAIKYRNTFINNDKSNIFKEYIKNKLDDIFIRLKTIIQDNPNTQQSKNDTQITENTRFKINSSIESAKKDKLYKDMIFRLKKNIYRNENLQEKLIQEKNEFYRTVKNPTKHEIQRTLISIGLGGAIFDPSSLFVILSNINISNKSVKIRQWIVGLLKISEDLELRTKTKSTYEQKRMILEFLDDCLHRKHTNYDAAFEIRSEIMNLYFKRQTDIDKENLHQQNYIKELIDIIDNTQDVFLGLKYTKDITENYITYILTSQKKDKDTLLRNFE